MNLLLYALEYEATKDEPTKFFVAPSSTIDEPTKDEPPIVKMKAKSNKLGQRKTK